MVKVEIYTSEICPYCIRAKSLLSSKNVEIIEYRIDTDENERTKMLERTNGARSVPQIFIDDVHVGNSDDLHALERE
ncbi:MAG: glutaredoxin 3 [Bacteroidetes bacterium]|nr:glutaredoxin 3 [Bacteroidota bacterium]